MKYLTHDVERENPVWFQWQILDWDISKEESTRIGLVLSSETQEYEDKYLLGNTLEKTFPPVFLHRQGRVTENFRAYKIADYSARESRNRELGLAGELQVLKFERDSLEAQGLSELAIKVRHISQIEGDGAGYDILSYSPDGQKKYIEVKTTAGAAKNSFYMTRNEVIFSELHSNSYYIYRVYNFDVNTNTGKFYIRSGNIASTFRLTATEYRVTPM